MEDEPHELIDERDDEEYYVDAYGRVTYFTCKIGFKNIPIF